MPLEITFAANRHDIEQAVALGGRYHRESPSSWMSFDAEKTTEYMQRCHIGCLVCGTGKSWGLAAVKLLHAFKRWAATKTADVLYVSIASGVRLQQTDRFLRRLGFQQAGGNYALPVNGPATADIGAP